MRHKILTILGALAAITGLASSAHAQSAVAPSSPTGEVTLSGNSLVGLQNRTIRTDFNRFFVGNYSTTSPNRTGSIESNNISSNNNLSLQDPGVLQISDDVQVVSNEPVYHPSTRVPGQQNIPFHNTDRVQVQVDLSQ